MSDDLTERPSSSAQPTTQPVKSPPPIPSVYDENNGQRPTFEDLNHGYFPIPE